MKKSNEKITPLRGLLDFIQFGFSFTPLIKPALKAGLKYILQPTPQKTVEPNIPHRQFRHPGWRENRFFKILLSQYFFCYKTSLSLINTFDLEKFEKKQLLFITQLFFDAFSPANFPFTNPEVIQKTIETRGKNLQFGFKQFLKDLRQWHGYLNITRTPMDAFTLGKNIATTPGHVVFENTLMQLIQYIPQTPTIHREPMLILSSWINKYYVFDLKPAHSFVKWLVENGHTVFVISWINPNITLKEKSFSDYLKEGILEAVQKIQHITKTKKIHAVGYCLGGTLLAATAAYCAAQKKDYFHTITLLASLLDFSDPGSFENLTGDAQLRFFENNMKNTGIWSAEKMSAAFNLIAMNEAIWFYWVRHYLLAKMTPPYDALYWAMDMTHTPEALYRFYTRVLYHENGLVKRKIYIDGVLVDITKISIPVFCLGLKEDYISPWQSVYQSYRHLKTQAHFVCAPGGHFNGITNSPRLSHSKYWCVDRDRQIRQAEMWEKQAKEYPGTWQMHWLAWIEARSSGKKVRAKQRLISPHAESAPGRYAL